MRVLVACEESQAVCKAFRAKGHEAFSCDIQDCSGGHPEWHIKGDVLPILNGNCTFVTADTHTHTHTARSMGFNYRASALHLSVERGNKVFFSPLYGRRKGRQAVGRKGKSGGFLHALCAG